MSGSLAAFVVIDLPRPITVHAKADTKRNKSTLDLQDLLQSNCRLISSSRVAKRFQIYLQFESLRECVFAVGGFARSQSGGKGRTQPVRIGITLGEIPDEDKKLDFPAYAKARWLTGITSQASILVSEGAAAVAHDLNLLPYGIEEFGEFFDVKSGQLSQVFSIAHPQLPPLEKVDDDGPKHNIPWPTEFFIGRAVEIETVCGMLEQLPYVRLIGPSGVGKSTLARRIGLEVVDEFRDGIKYADLSKVTDRPGLLAQVFRSIDFPVEQTAELNLELARKYFGGKNHLLILDGCEDLEAHVEQLVRALLRTSRVQILATSIQSSNTLQGVEYLVEDLPVPALDEITCLADIEGIDACALFIDGMRKFRQGLPPQDSEAPTIFEICRRTGGSPLALNLVARRLRFESLKNVLSDYQTSTESPQLNESVARTLNRLPPSCKNLIEYASAFASTWTRSQLATLMARKPGSLYEDLQTLQTLGLVKEQSDSQGRGRFVLSSRFRSGIRFLLQQESRLNSIRESHLLMVLNRCQTAIQEMNGPNQGRHLDFLDSAAQDLESALLFLIESSSSANEFIEAMRSTWFYWFKRNRLRAVLNLADQCLDRFGLDDSTAAARLKMLKAIFLTKAGRTDVAITLLNEAIKVSDQNQQSGLFCQLHINLGIALSADDRPLEAMQAYTLAAKTAEKLENHSMLTSAITGLCNASISSNDLPSAKMWQKRLWEVAGNSLDILDRWNLIMGDIQLAWIREDYRSASELVQKCMDEARHGGDSALVSRTYLWKAQVEVSRGQMESAATSLGSCISIMNSDEHNFHRANIRRIQEIEKCIVDQLGGNSLNQFKFAGSLESLNWL